MVVGDEFEKTDDSRKGREGREGASARARIQGLRLGFGANYSARRPVRKFADGGGNGILAERIFSFFVHLSIKF
jgi:hypothetical protein